MEHSATSNPFDASEVESLSFVLDFLPSPLLISEAKNGLFSFRYANQKFRQEMGYQAEDIPTLQDFFDHAYPDPAYRAAVLLEWDTRTKAALAAGRNDVFMKTHIQTKSAGKQWYEVKNIIQGSWHLMAFVNINNEILKQKELEESNENKNQVLSIFSHDLRSTITNLHAISTLALNENLSPDEFNKNLKDLNSQSIRVVEFFDNLLMWTKSNFNKITIRKLEVDWQDMIKEILYLYENAMRRKGITVSLQLGVTDKLITDRGILTIVIRNLISNAIKFTPDKGNIVIRKTQEGTSIVLSVIDSGIGMNATMIDSIFSNQYASTRGTRNEQGAGVGLKLSRELLAKIDGHLKIESKLGTGTEISVVI